MSEHEVDLTNDEVSEGDDVVGEVLPFRPRLKAVEKCCGCGSEVTINDTIKHITHMLEAGEVKALGIVVVTAEDQSTVLFEYGATVSDSGKVLLGLEVLKARVVQGCLAQEDEE